MAAILGTARHGIKECWNSATLPPSTSSPPDLEAEAIPLRIPISLADLEPGIYSLQIQVLDEVGKQGVTQIVEFMVQ